GRVSADFAGDQRDHERLLPARCPERAGMTARSAPSFVRDDLVPERRAPVRTTSLARLLQTRLFSSPSNALLTVVGAALLWFFLVPAIRFLFIDAVWEGQNRTACLAADAGQSFGACWPFIQAKITQF